MRYFIFFVFLFVLSGCATEEKTTESDTTLSGQRQETREEKSVLREDNSLPIKSMKPEENCFIFDDFSVSQDYTWGIVNDGVMGGKSQGKVQIVDQVLVFSGTIVTRGGGFSSLRAGLEPGILSEYSSVKLRAKSEGREYRITFRDSRWGNISHRTVIPFQNPGEFEEVTINFTDLVPAYFGRQVDAKSFEKESAREIGVILSDGVDGEFELVIDEVRFCK